MSVRKRLVAMKLSEKVALVVKKPRANSVSHELRFNPFLTTTKNWIAAFSCVFVTVAISRCVCVHGTLNCPCGSDLQGNPRYNLFLTTTKKKLLNGSFFSCRSGFRCDEDSEQVCSFFALIALTVLIVVLSVCARLLATTVSAPLNMLPFSVRWCTVRGACSTAGFHRRYHCGHCLDRTGRVWRAQVPRVARSVRLRCRFVQSRRFVVHASPLLSTRFYTQLVDLPCRRTKAAAPRAPFWLAFVLFR